LSSFIGTPKASFYQEAGRRDSTSVSASNPSYPIYGWALVSWGFERAYNAVCFCDAIAGSTVFRSGYEWAKRQTEDYLMLHFGLYFDDWNEKGFARISDDRIEALLGQISISRLLPGTATGEEKGVPEGISVDEVLIEGIMAGLKEIKLQGH